MSRRRWALSVDVGGTFTDVILVDRVSGHAFHNKAPSTRRSPALAVAASVREILSEAKARPQDVDSFSHGTTVATNALLQRNFAKTALITTAGFRDVLEIRRQRQPHMYDARVPKPDPIVPRYLRKEVAERTYLFGKPSIVPDKEDVRRIATELLVGDVEAVAVCFLHSYANPQHEADVVGWLRDLLPGVFVSASHEVFDEFREYERTSTVCVNAALGPILGEYVHKLEMDALEIGVPVPNILLSSGGVAAPRDVARLPVRALYSGPAAGVIAAEALVGRLGISDALTLDVGGTSADVSIIHGGRAGFTQERELSGHPVRAPMIDVHSVGAGGGSIAWVDQAGFLHVGPHSAGAEPGPAGYGRGGEAATVTDAAIVLGLVNPRGMLAGRVEVRADLAAAAIESEVAAPMGLDIASAAQAVLTLVNEGLIQAVRVMSVERGFDPRQVALVAFGGAGPLLAGPLARELGIRQTIVPEVPGLQCAVGLLTAGLRADFSVTCMAVLEQESLPMLAASSLALKDKADQWFTAGEVVPSARLARWSADVRYVGQGHELEAELTAVPDSTSALARVISNFSELHERSYGYVVDGPVELVTLRLAVFRLGDSINIQRTSMAGDSDQALCGIRSIAYTGSDGFDEAKIYDRSLLSVGAILEGPAIIEQMDATTLVLSGQLANVHDTGSLIITEAQEGTVLQ